MSEGRRWNAAIINRAGVSLDVVDSQRALCCGCMRQHQLTSDIPDGPKMRQRLSVDQYPHAVVDRHKAAISLHTNRLKIEPLATWHPTSSDEHRIHLQAIHQLTAFHLR
ncbi:hypothetical protein PMIT1327_00006 [Prochlorococcus marinus str. MIT 1327]|nr:hypothetical protein PMIT1312_00162 [Prochlorococcus marinus str. MIT 1312]KZR85220.1 hypothetical protein PMIT1327_00006 [Prochlorococcus marinus str. MIT 1327]